MENKEERVFVPYELPRQVRKAFDNSYILYREDLEPTEKVGYLKAVNEINNFLLRHRDE